MIEAFWGVDSPNPVLEWDDFRQKVFILLDFTLFIRVCFGIVLRFRSWSSPYSASSRNAAQKKVILAGMIRKEVSPIYILLFSVTGIRLSLLKMFVLELSMDALGLFKAI
uniref:Uncharacterized protein n=1 Tax=Solanum lycopersicum TaxID=4081 RepID=A0A3Q7G3Z8_SOLLC